MIRKQTMAPKIRDTIANNRLLRKVVTLWIPASIILMSILYLVGIVELNDAIQAGGSVILGASIMAVLVTVYEYLTDRDD